MRKCRREDRKSGILFVYVARETKSHTSSDLCAIVVFVWSAGFAFLRDHKDIKKNVDKKWRKKHDSSKYHF